MTTNLTDTMIQDRNSVDYRFVYQPDEGSIDHWEVTKNGDVIWDDCDGFALTLLYELADRSWFKFWWLQITCQACIWHVKSYRGNGHIVLWYKGWWADNMEHKWYVSQEMRHTRRFPWIWPTVAVKLLVGKLLPNKDPYA